MEHENLTTTRLFAANKFFILKKIVELKKTK